MRADGINCKLVQMQSPTIRDSTVHQQRSPPHIQPPSGSAASAGLEVAQRGGAFQYPDLPVAGGRQAAKQANCPCFITPGMGRPNHWMLSDQQSRGPRVSEPQTPETYPSQLPQNGIPWSWTGMLAIHVLSQHFVWRASLSFLTQPPTKEQLVKHLRDADLPHVVLINKACVCIANLPGPPAIVGAANKLLSIMAS